MRNTSNFWKYDLSRILTTNVLTNQTPSKLPPMTLDGLSVTPLTVGPRFTASSNRAVLHGTIPFTFMATNQIEATRCASGPYVLLSNSATQLSNITCYTSNDVPGS